jgi:hypothetical protein
MPQAMLAGKAAGVKIFRGIASSPEAKGTRVLCFQSRGGLHCSPSTLRQGDDDRVLPAEGICNVCRGSTRSKRRGLRHHRLGPTAPPLTFEVSPKAAFERAVSPIRAVQNESGKPYRVPPGGEKTGAASMGSRRSNAADRHFQCHGPPLNISPGGGAMLGLAFSPG